VPHAQTYVDEMRDPGPFHDRKRRLRGPDQRSQTKGGRRHLQRIGREIAGDRGEGSAETMAQAVRDHQDLARSGRREKKTP
jgi:hypothetical protein